jgi:parvulin-like peptidyl-prolyl isomerase
MGMFFDMERIMGLRHGSHKRTPCWCWLILMLAVSATLPGAALIADNGEQSFAKIQQEPPDSDPTLKVAIPGIQQIRRPRTPDDPVPKLEDGTIVATVNGQPIFAGKVLAPAAAIFAEKDALLRKSVGKEYKPEMLDGARLIFIGQSLPEIINRRLLVQAAKVGSTKSQADALKKAIVHQWNEELDLLMKQNNVNTVDELVQVLKKSHFNLEDRRVAFEEKKVAQMYVSSMVNTKYQPSQLEMIAFYKEHKEEFKSVGKVRWNQLVVSHQEHGGTEGAKKQVDKVVKELSAGADFSMTVKKYGDGPRVVKGGAWEWTERGDLQSKEVEDQIFSLPVGDMSGAIETKDSFQVVQVLERTEDNYTPFEQLREKINERMISKVYSDNAKELLRTVRESAIIVTCFDEEWAAQKKRAPVEE